MLAMKIARMFSPAGRISGICPRAFGLQQDTRDYYYGTGGTG